MSTLVFFKDNNIDISEILSIVALNIRHPDNVGFLFAYIKITCLFKLFNSDQKLSTTYVGSLADPNIECYNGPDTYFESYVSTVCSLQPSRFPPLIMCKTSHDIHVAEQYLNLTMNHKQPNSSVAKSEMIVLIVQNFFCCSVIVVSYQLKVHITYKNTCITVIKTNDLTVLHDLCFTCGNL